MAEGTAARKRDHHGRAIGTGDDARRRRARNAPAPARGDNTARARFTLAASVALVLGATWYLSDGFQPGTRPTGNAPAIHGPGMLNDSDAKGTKGGVLDKTNEIKGKDNGGAFKPKVDLNDE